MHSEVVFVEQHVQALAHVVLLTALAQRIVQPLRVAGCVRQNLKSQPAHLHLVSIQLPRTGMHPLLPAGGEARPHRPVFRLNMLLDL